VNDSDGAIGELVGKAAGGDEVAMAALFDRHRGRLRQMIRLRLDRRLRGRVDESDVLQEAYLDLARKLPEYARSPSVPFFLWLRLVAGERLLRVHRQHLGAAMRDAGREIPIHGGGIPQASSVSLAGRLLGRVTSASRAMSRAESRRLLRDALDRMDPVDREVIALRHFEELTNDEAAVVLELTKSAASKRYVRAMVRLKAVLSETPGVADPSLDG
jgi:RNA polymerase sigma-70 factor (ECF subfamily)